MFVISRLHQLVIFKAHAHKQWETFTETVLRQNPSPFPSQIRLFLTLLHAGKSAIQETHRGTGSNSFVGIPKFSNFVKNLVKIGNNMNDANSEHF
jgi:hypothetical protein